MMINQPPSINKPLPCHQKWEDMTPAEIGRICHGCGKHVTDFRAYSWADITKVHTDSPIPVCGIYSDEQLNTWGQEVTTRQLFKSKLLPISAAILTFIQCMPTTLHAQSSTPQEQTQIVKHTENKKPSFIDPKRERISGTVVVQQTDSLMVPLHGVLVYVLQDTTHLRATTDSFGRFVIDITNRFGQLPDTLNVIVSHPDYLLEPVMLHKNNLGPIDIILSQVTIKQPAISVFQTTSTFYAVVSTDASTSAGRVHTKTKKWWQFWKRTKI